MRCRFFLGSSGGSISPASIRRCSSAFSAASRAFLSARFRFLSAAAAASSSCFFCTRAERRPLADVALLPDAGKSSMDEGGRGGGGGRIGAVLPPTITQSCVSKKSMGSREVSLLERGTTTSTKDWRGSLRRGESGLRRDDSCGRIGVAGPEKDIEVDDIELDAAIQSAQSLTSERTASRG